MTTSSQIARTGPGFSFPWASKRNLTSFLQKHGVKFASWDALTDQFNPIITESIPSSVSFDECRGTVRDDCLNRVYALARTAYREIPGITEVDLTGITSSIGRSFDNLLNDCIRESSLQTPKFLARRDQLTSGWQAAFLKGSSYAHLQRR